MDRDIGVRFFALALLVITLTAGFTRFATLTTRSLDNDETITAFDITATPYFWLPRDDSRPVNSYGSEHKAVRKTGVASPLRVVRTVQRNEEHPPFYFLLQSLWCRGFGIETGGLRSLSAFLGLLAIPALAFTALYITRRRSIGLLAALVLLLSPLHQFFSQEARPYALLTLIAIASLYCFARLEREQSWKWAVWLGLTYTLGIYTQYLFALLPLAQLAYCLLSFRGRRVLSKCAVAVGAWVVLFLPWAPVLINQLSHKAKFTGLHNSVSLSERLQQGAYAFASYWCGMSMHTSRILCLLAAVVAWAAILWWILRKDKPPTSGQVVSIALLPFFLPVLAWLTWSLPDIWTRPKHWLFLLPALTICFGLSLLAMKRWRGVVVALVVIVPMAVNLIGYFHSGESKSDVRAAAAYLRKSVSGQDLLVTQGSCSQISYYTPGIPNRVHITKWTPELLSSYRRVALFRTEDLSAPSPDTVKTRAWLRTRYVLHEQISLYYAAVEIYTPRTR